MTDRTAVAELVASAARERARRVVDLRDSADVLPLDLSPEPPPDRKPWQCEPWRSGLGLGRHGVPRHAFPSLKLAAEQWNAWLAVWNAPRHELDVAHLSAAEALVEARQWGALAIMLADELGADAPLTRAEVPLAFPPLAYILAQAEAWEVAGDLDTAARWRYAAAVRARALEQ